MYQHLFQLDRVRNLHAAYSMAHVFERYTKILLGKGYSIKAIWRYLYAWEAFSTWIDRKKIPLAEVDETTVVSFIEYRSKHRVWRGKKIGALHILRKNRPALQHLLRFLREDGNIPPPSEPSGPVPWYVSPIENMADYLRSHRGLSTSTIEHCCLEVRLYLESLGISSWQDALKQMNSSSIDAYLFVRFKTLKCTSRCTVASPLRTFFRYLHVTRQLPDNYAYLVPTIRQYKLASIPKSLAWSDIQKVLLTIDRSTSAGRRDYAMMILLATYGLRRCEVTSLCFEDIDWKNSIIRVRHLKSGNYNNFPLLPEVGEAIIAYLKNGRPNSEYRQIFLSLHAPHAPLRPGCALRERIQIAFKATGIQTRGVGPHTFRHSFAVHLLQKGCSLKTIGDILGHRSPLSTFVYTKVHTESLREVALDIGEVLS